MSRRWVLPILLAASAVQAQSPVYRPPLKMKVFATSRAESRQGSGTIALTGADGRRLDMKLLEPAPARVRPVSDGAPLVPVPRSMIEPAESPRPRARRRFSFNYELSGGYQSEDLNWAVASPGTGDVVTEVDWQGVDWVGIDGRMRIESPSHWVALADAGYARLVDGQVAEQSLLAGRTLSRSRFSGEEGYRVSGSVGLGYALSADLGEARATLTPAGGFTALRERLSSGNNPTRRFLADWYGPWAGGSAALDWQAHRLFASFRYAWLEYDADGKTPTDGDLTPLRFSQRANARGWNALAGYRYQPSFWGMELAFDWQRYDAWAGRERADLPDGSSIESRLLDAGRETLGVRLGLSVDF